MKCLALLILALLTAACGRRTYTLANGQNVTCGSYNVQACGITLAHCDDGNIYTCQNNVVER